MKKFITQFIAGFMLGIYFIYLNVLDFMRRLYK